MYIYSQQHFNPTACIQTVVFLYGDNVVHASPISDLKMKCL